MTYRYTGTKNTSIPARKISVDFLAKVAPVVLANLSHRFDVAGVPVAAICRVAIAARAWLILPACMPTLALTIG